MRFISEGDQVAVAAEERRIRELAQELDIDPVEVAAQMVCSFRKARLAAREALDTALLQLQAANPAEMRF